MKLFMSETLTNKHILLYNKVSVLGYFIIECGQFWGFSARILYIIHVRSIGILINSQMIIHNEFYQLNKFGLDTIESVILLHNNNLY